MEPKIRLTIRGQDDEPIWTSLWEYFNDAMDDATDRIEEMSLGTRDISSICIERIGE